MISVELQARRADLEHMLLSQRNAEGFGWLSFANYLGAKADDPDGRGYDQAVELLAIYAPAPADNINPRTDTPVGSDRIACISITTRGGDTKNWYMDDAYEVAKVLVQLVPRHHCCVNSVTLVDGSPDDDWINDASEFENYLRELNDDA